MPPTTAILKDFRAFILRGNLVDLAIAVVIGAAFTTVVNAMVRDLITPIIAALARQVVEDAWSEYRDQLKSLRASTLDSALTLLWDTGHEVLSLTPLPNLPDK